ncbi:MAG: hypothetical protein HC880_12810 [Bacteroidia bacterium]|nr:hypothetical protein [Bacteroidia bacterium]
MGFYWKNLIKLPSMLRQLRQGLRNQQAFTQALLQPYWQWPNPDESLKKSDLRRMQDYPLQFIVFFAEWWCMLKPRTLTPLERQRLTYYAAFLCLYDDFFDESPLSPEQLRCLVDIPEAFVPTSAKETLAKDLILRLYDCYSPGSAFKTVWDSFYQAQWQSKAQMAGSALSRAEILQISADKGGYALMLSYLLLEDLPQPGEMETCYALGAWFQFLDDVVDIDKDIRNGVRTFINTATDVGELEEGLARQGQLAFSCLRQLPYPLQEKEKVLFRFFIIGMSGWIHLRRLKKLQRRTLNRFLPHQYPPEDIRWVENRPSNIFWGIWNVARRSYG